MDNFQSKIYEITIYGNVSTKENIGLILTLKLSCEQASFCIGMGSSPLARKFHEKHNGTYQ